MKYLCLVLSFFYFHSVKAQSFATDTEIDPAELRCLVCEKSIYEINREVNKLDPNKKVDVGGYRLDAQGNYEHKTVPQTKSELALSEIIEGVCNKMDNYIRAKWKNNGSLTLLNMLTDIGTMNPDWSDVDIIQDGDLNKSLKFYCEGIMEEHEEEIITLYQKGETDVSKAFCITQSNICTDFKSPKLEL
ncbi:protein seele [Diorhabda sublineata]|uniref:protein seele n=1 Tax=Diorhabda sublineata TaxID=1163346 RepID=UPI0024E06672|nr:protein seele [Diorhabda sublineata]